MAEYIKREALIQHMQECKDENAFTLMATGYAYSFIEAAPSADVVEVVRCKDCKHYMDFGNRHSYCTHFSVEDDILFMAGPDTFCSDGERRSEE